jgi:hypothetical protein
MRGGLIIELRKKRDEFSPLDSPANPYGQGLVSGLNIAISLVKKEVA